MEAEIRRWTAEGEERMRAVWSTLQNVLRPGGAEDTAAERDAREKAERAAIEREAAEDRAREKAERIAAERKAEEAREREQAKKATAAREKIRQQQSTDEANVEAMLFADSETVAPSGATRRSAPTSHNFTDVFGEFRSTTTSSGDVDILSSAFANNSFRDGQATSTSSAANDFSSLFGEEPKGGRTAPSNASVDDWSSAFGDNSRRPQAGTSSTGLDDLLSVNESRNRQAPAAPSGLDELVFGNESRHRRGGAIHASLDDFGFSGESQSQSATGSSANVDDFFSGGASHSHSRSHGAGATTPSSADDWTTVFGDSHIRRAVSANDVVDEWGSAFGGSQKGQAATTSANVDDWDSVFGDGSRSGRGTTNPASISGNKTKDHQRSGIPLGSDKARMNRQDSRRQQADKAVHEMRQRDFQSQSEQMERQRSAAIVDAAVKRWAAGKEGNLRALLSSLQDILWPEFGWAPVSMSYLITPVSVKKVYRRALYIHPDKLQQKGATIQQKYTAEKVFHHLQLAYTKFNAEELV